MRNFDEATWRLARYDIVVKSNTAKFSQIEPLRSFLLNTGQPVLAEASPVDRIWGIGLAADDPRTMHPEQWQGLNLLGFALMDARDALEAAYRQGSAIRPERLSTKTHLTQRETTYELARPHYG